MEEEELKPVIVPSTSCETNVKLTSAEETENVFCAFTERIAQTKNTANMKFFIID